MAMTKEQVLEFISEMDWAEHSWQKEPVQEQIESAIARYVVYKTDPDTRNAYGHAYYLNKEDAMTDFESRTTTDRLCYCTIAEMHGDWRQQREIYGNFYD